MTLSIRLLLSLALVGVVSSLGAGTILGPDRAWAQTARDLTCRKCVDPSDIAKNAVTRQKVKDGTVNLKRLEARLGERASSTQPVYATLDTTSQQTVVRHGPLSIIFQCSVDEAGNDVIRIFATSTVAGWFTGDGVDDSGDFTGPNAAGEEILLNEISVTTGTTRVDDIDQGDVITAPGGFLLSTPDDVSMGAFNALGHVCTFAGIFHLITETS